MSNSSLHLNPPVHPQVCEIDSIVGLHSLWTAWAPHALHCHPTPSTLLGLSQFHMKHATARESILQLNAESWFGNKVSVPSHFDLCAVCGCVGEGEVLHCADHAVHFVVPFSCGVRSGGAVVSVYHRCCQDTEKRVV